MASIFSRIIAGEIPCYKIAETADCFAFLDINPNAKGHTLCVPKREVDKLFDLSEQEYASLMGFARAVAIALEKAVPCNRVGVAVVGLEVPHAHIHLIPITQMSQMTFTQKEQFTPEQMQQIAQNIQQAMQ